MKVQGANVVRRNVSSSRTTSATNGASMRSRATSASDADLLSRVKEAIAENGDGSSKADVIDALGITSGQWNKAIKVLLSSGLVIQTGERRGARYHLPGGDD